MEDNKPFMPPPPPKMPPFPPNGQMGGQKPVQTAEVKAENQPLPEDKVPENEISPENMSVVNDNNKVEGVKSEKIKEPKTQEQKKKTLATALYWVGFAACIIGIGLCIYFIVK